jgi:hypothetical protein
MARAPLPHDALQLPEILRAVMEALQSTPKSLYAAALVSRAWAREALDILWRSPPDSAIRAVTAGERRAFYAAKICELRDAVGDEAYRDLPLPRLRRLSLEMSRYMPPPDPAQRYYIRPQLQELSGLVTHPILEALIAQSPSLRAITIDGNGQQLPVPADRLVDYIASCERLESLTLLCTVADTEALLRRLWPVLAQHRHLTQLRIIWATLPASFIWEALQQIQEQQQQRVATAKPFALVRHLRINTSARAALALAGVMPAVRELVLDVPDAPAELLPCIALLPTRQQLRNLTISAWDMDLSWPALLALRGLSQLQSFWMRARALSWSSADSTEVITGEHIRSLLSPLRLRTLGIDAPLPIEPNVLGAIGEACPTLYMLKISGSYSLRALALTPAPSMPNLEVLMVTSFSPEQDTM